MSSGLGLPYSISLLYGSTFWGYSKSSRANSNHEFVGIKRIKCYLPRKIHWRCNNALDIQTTCLSQKLSHWRLGPFIVEWRIGPMAYRLKLPHWMKQLHPVFNIVKLTPAPEDPITGRRMEDHPPPIVINGEAEWEVEEILNSCWHQRRF